MRGSGLVLMKQLRISLHTMQKKPLDHFWATNENEQLNGVFNIAVKLFNFLGPAVDDSMLLCPFTSVTRDERGYDERDIQRPREKRQVWQVEERRGRQMA